MAAQMIASATIPVCVPSVMPVSGMPTPKETIANLPAYLVKEGLDDCRLIVGTEFTVRLSGGTDLIRR